MKKARSQIQISMKKICGHVHSVTSRTIQCHVSVLAAGLKDMSGFLT